MENNTFHIVLAEHNELLRKVLKDRLNIEENFKISTVVDGLELQAYLLENSYDLIIAEELLPFKSAFELLKLANEKNIPMIIISDADLEEKILEAFSLGAADFIDKPFSPNEMVARAKNIFRKRLQST
ncbi:response regulator transcription factor [Marivirga sp.]|uniref:response regulator transcription factor n=1 Tax=Marivirga sp. TaxID=2018662 RepID=UPI002D7E4735|nr:response regulator [Marivirga sp.]HET8859610.1 response regulator [Marivirga sp.]